jgi:hypothetical protein
MGTFFSLWIRCTAIFNSITFVTALYGLNRIAKLEKATKTSEFYAGLGNYDVNVVTAALQSRQERF